MLRRMQQQVQQLDQARAQAEQDRAAALADNEALTREIAGEIVTARRERAARGRLERELEAARKELDALRARLGDTEKQLADSQARQQVDAQALRQLHTVKERTARELSGVSRDLTVCRAHNGQLYGLGREMMQRYREKTCADAVAQIEPFTGLKRVEVENLLETWRDRLDGEKIGVPVSAEPNGASLPSSGR
ncbi:hypothetical protein [Thiobacillus denitrificans]|nr:hypothetical protein [Thiobacillus denitrificans]